MPLYFVDIKVDLIDKFAKIYLTHKYFNPSSKVVSTVFKFSKEFQIHSMDLLLKRMVKLSLVLLVKRIKSKEISIPRWCGYTRSKSRRFLTKDRRRLFIIRYRKHITRGVHQYNTYIRTSNKFIRKWTILVAIATYTNTKI